MILILQSEEAYNKCPRDVIAMSSYVAYATGNTVYHVVKHRATGWTGFTTLKDVTRHIQEVRDYYDKQRSTFEVYDLP